MSGVEFILLFFIIYDVIITWLFLYINWKMRTIINKKENLIDDLNNELAKIHKK